MAHIESDDDEAIPVVRRSIRVTTVQDAQVMLVAAGIAAFGIVAVAAAMLHTLL